MSFGLRDKDWVDPPEREDYKGACTDCEHFTECGCGCGWGYCHYEPTELYDGSVFIECESGEPNERSLYEIA